MITGLQLVLGVVAGVASFLLTGTFGDTQNVLVQETIPIPPANTAGRPNPLEPSPMLSPEPAAPAVLSSEDTCVTEQTENGGQRITCQSEQDGTATVEAHMESDSAHVNFKQNIDSSSSVKSTASLKVSTDN